jgi:hypothetical protein
MNKLSAILLMLIFGLSSKAQICSTDSVVKVLIRDRGDNFSNTYDTDSFDVVNGIELYSMSPFTRRYLTFNTNHDTLNFVLMNGTGSGYTNSRRIDFAYNPANLILSRAEFAGAGTTWNLLRTETWNYNGSNQITDYTLTDTSGNILKTIYNYSGNIRQSIMHQIGSGVTWTNDRLFNIVYTNNSRDSLILKKWDPLSSSWIDSLASKYTFTIDFSATLTDTIIQGTRTNINSFTYDTLDFVTSEYHSDSIWSGMYTAKLYRYKNIHSHRVTTKYIYWSMGCVNSDNNYTYDQYAVELSHGYAGHCGIGSGGGNSRVYDSDYRMISKESYGYSSVSDNYHYWNYYYFSPDSINLNYLPIGALGGVGSCMGDSINPPILIGGGCGPYSYSWTPATGLSATNRAQPEICIGNDTITYTITVTDTTGHSGQTTFSAFPKFSATISFDTSACPGCPVILQANIISGASYRWYRNDTLIPLVNTSAYTATNSGNYFVVIQQQSCIVYSDTIALTLSGLTRISGNIYWDRDSNCIYSGVDTSLSVFGFTPFLIGISRANYQIIISPDTNGYYDIPIDTGEFVIKLYNPSQILTSDCLGSDSLVITIPAYGDTLANNDFPLKGDISCKRLELRVWSTQFRACQSAVIAVRYFNAALNTENNASVDVSIPSELIVTGASLPYTVNGNIYTFDLPSLSVGEIGTITISANVTCNLALLNATLCLEAQISPKDICSLNPDSSWDGSNIRVTSFCNNDSSACFIIRNESLLSNGNMSASAIWKLYKDNILSQQGTFLLTANSDTTLCFVSDGSTYRLEASQTSGFPVQRNAFANIERCGPDTNNYSLNQILNHFSAETLPFYYTYCHRITNSFDPNIKSVQPEGLGPDHYIPSGQLMKYRIDFQNTGSDTALYVEIRDRLNIFFDHSSISFIGSSHPNQIDFNNGEITWKFQNINLPDSNTNELASHGYVEFFVRTKATLTNGTPIQNYANIYFDFNAPIQTPVIRNEICNVANPSVTISPDSGFCIGNVLKCRATIQNGGYYPALVVNWYVNGVMQSMHRDSLTYTGIDLNDTIVCTVQSSIACAYPSIVTSNILIFDQYSIPLPLITFNTPDLVSSSAESYQWYYNQSVISGAIFQNYTPLNDGPYQVQIWDSAGCTAISNSFSHVGIGIQENNNSGLIVYPNPANSYLNIRNISPIHSINVLDAFGKSLFFIKSNSNTMSIELKDLSTGSYLLEISTDEGRLYKRFAYIRQ